MLTSENISNALRSLCAALQTPVILILFVIAAITVVFVGWIIVELIAERRHLRVWMPKLVDDLQKGTGQPAEIIRTSGLLRRQKIILMEITEHKELSDEMREALAIRLLEEARGRYDLIVRCSDLIVRLGPVFGLLGTLIPLGPGIIALGQGDTYTLSQSLLTAFDTTVLGLICAAVCTVISTIRKKWYKNDMSILETLMECILEIEKDTALQTDGSADDDDAGTGADDSAADTDANDTVPESGKDDEAADTGLSDTVAGTGADDSAAGTDTDPEVEA